MDKEPALETLLEVFSARADLQEVYPEVSGGNYARLIDWAHGVSAAKWKDNSFSVLRPYAEWYEANFTGAAPPITSILWSVVAQTSGRAANPMPLTLGVMQDETAADISYHLPTLSLLVIEFGLKNIVELGVRTGNSTLVLLEAAHKIGGRVLSVDVEPCLEARQRVAKAGLSAIWQFLEGSDLELQESHILQPIDLLFVDTNHLYAHTMQELRKYSPLLREGSWIALHDYVSFPGVMRAVQEFLVALPKKQNFYPYLHQNGLALIRWRTSH